MTSIYYYNKKYTKTNIQKPKRQWLLGIGAMVRHNPAQRS